MVKPDMKKPDFFDQLEDIDEDKKEQTELLGQLGEQVIAMEAQMIEVGKREDNLQKAQDKYQKLAMDIVPDLMDQLGLSELKLKSGRKLTVKDELSVSIKKGANHPFITWMIKRGFQALVKNKVEVQFPKEGRKSSQSFVKYIRRYYKNKCTMQEKETVHPQTLKAWAKGQREEGKNLPDKFLNIFPYKIAKIK